MQAWICLKDKGSNLLSIITWSVLGKQNVQARKVYCIRKRGIKWNFNPPHSSHAGGVWERMTLSIRRILRVLLGCQLVDDETLLPSWWKLRRYLIYRPFTPLTTDSNDPEPLSPSKLLVLRPNVCYSPEKSHAVHIYKSKRWKQDQYLADILWKLWTWECLPPL